MKLSKLYHSNANNYNFDSMKKSAFELPLEIKNRMHYLSTHAKKTCNADKEARYKECVKRWDKLAEYYSYDIYIDDESFPNIGTIRLVSDKILLLDEFTQDTDMDILQMLNEADEVTIDNFIDVNNWVVLTIKYYLFDIAV